MLALPSLLNRGAASGGFSETITYSAMQSISAIPRTDGDYQDIWLSSELTVNAFTDWVKGSSFRQELAALVPDANLAALGIAADNAHSVGQIYLSYPNADGSASSRRRRDHGAFDPQSGLLRPVGRAACRRDRPRTDARHARAAAITDRFGALIRIGLGLIAGIGLAFLAHYLDPVLRRREDVESLGLPVVGAIPRK